MASHCPPSQLSESQADKWRQQILREVGKKVLDIQNAGLGEHRLRDLNDEINKLIREKYHWEKRIVELGGPNYAMTARVKDPIGREVAELTGKSASYRYFGAAKTLPGVKELFEKDEAPKAVRRTRHQMHKAIDPDYYGFRDEEDGVLLRVEEEAEKQIRAEAILDWEDKEAERQAALSLGKGGAQGITNEAEDSQFVAFVPLPDQKAIEQKVLEKKKQDLLAKYQTSSLIASQADAKEMLNVQR